MALGVLLRVAVELAYWPAVVFPDSGDYMRMARILRPSLWHPIGYSLLLRVLGESSRVLPPSAALATVTVVQHLLGLTAAVLLYGIQRRAGVGRTLAALATAPVLIDPMEVWLEQYVLSDVLFMFIAVGVLWLLTQRRATPRWAALLGLLVAYATLVRTIGLVLVAAVGTYWLVSRIGVRALAAAATAVVLPLAAYAGVMEHRYHFFGLQGYTGRWLYGQVAQFADCRKVRVPPKMRPLCPTQPVAARTGPSEFVWDSNLPYDGRHLPHDPVKRSQLAGVFARDMILGQPSAYASEVAGDLAHALAPGRLSGPRTWFVGSWRFWAPGAPPYWRTELARSGFGGKRIDPVFRPRLAAVLHDYERFVYTPGPLMALALGAGAGGLVVGWRRYRGRAIICGALLITAAGLLIGPILTVGLDYRYILVAEQLAVPAGAIGGTLVVEVLRARTAPRGWQALATSRSAGWAAGTLLCVALAASNVAAGEIYPKGTFPTPHPVPAGTTLDVNGRYALWVGKPTVRATACAGRHTVRYLLRFPIQQRWLSGGPLMASGDNTLVHYRQQLFYAYFAGRHVPGQLVPELVTREHPLGEGAIDVWFAHRSGVLTYSDPLGGGEAAFRFTRPATLTRHSNACGPPPPGGRASHSGLRVAVEAPPRSSPVHRRPA